MLRYSFKVVICDHVCFDLLFLVIIYFVRTGFGPQRLHYRKKSKDNRQIKGNHHIKQH